VQQLLQYHAKFLRVKDALYRQFVNLGRAYRVSRDVPDEVK